jgi:hypothetical protein
MPPRKGKPDCWGEYEEYPSDKYSRDCWHCGNVLGCAYKSRTARGFYK